MNDFNDFNNPNNFSRRRRVTYRPSRAQAGIGLAGGALFVVLGVTVAIPNFGAFGIIWTLLALGIAVYNGYMAFGKKYIGPEINIEDEGAPNPAPEGPSDAETRLTQLAALHEKGLITDEEYEEKRQEILDEI